MKKKFSLAGKNVLVTGGTGFIGSHLVEKLLKKKATVIVSYRALNPRNYFFSNNFQKKTLLVNADIKDKERVINIVSNYEIDFIFHFAAQSIVETAYWNPYEAFQTNILGTINILESARLYPKVKGVIVVSSDKAYGKSSKKYKESDALAGDHPYEVSKSCADLIAQTYFKTYKIPLAVTRFGNVYGPGDLNFNRIVPGIIKAIIHKETLPIRSDGRYRRDYIYVKDIIDGTFKLAEKLDSAAGHAFNFSSGNNYSVNDLIKKISKILRKKIDFKILNTAKNEIPNQSLDCQKAGKMLNWKSKYTLNKGIKETFRWYKKLL